MSSEWAHAGAQAGTEGNFGAPSRVPTGDRYVTAQTTLTKCSCAFTQSYYLEKSEFSRHFYPYSVTTVELQTENTGIKREQKSVAGIKRGTLGLVSIAIRLPGCPRLPAKKLNLNFVFGLHNIRVDIQRPLMKQCLRTPQCEQST